MNKNAHILVVDDEPDTVEILSRQLGLENYKILKAYSGQESLELLKKHKPDLILMDISMPGMDGFETIRIIRDTVKEFIPIIIVTASKDDTENITRGFAVGANDYIVIPCNKEELLARIKAMLRIKELHDALRASEEHYRTLIEASFDLIYVIGRDDTVQYVNPAALKALGRPAAEVNGKPRVSFLPPAFAASQKLSLDRVFATGEPLYHEMKMELAEGGAQWQDTQLIPLKSPSGSVDAVLGISRDITERKRAEEALLFKTMLLEAQSETSIDGILAVDNEGHAILFNKCFGELWKIPQHVLDTKDDKKMLEYVLKQLKDPAEFNRKVAHLYEHKDEKSRDEIEFADGRCLDRYSSPLTSADGKYHGRIWYFRDITERKLMQEKLLTSEKLAVMGRLTADMSHELNNPLAIVIGGSQLMLSRLGKKASPFKSQLEAVLRNARRCKSVISNLLGYSRTIGKKEEAINLPNLIREAIDDVNYQYDMSGVEIMLNYGKMANVKITGNSTALLSVFVNLIRNARQAMGEKGRLTVTIEKEDAKHLRIEIHDTGIGMNKEQKTKLFKPFASGWKEREGSGLGLATSLGIIETHGGSMSAESAGIGKGAAFTILLPCEFKRKK